MCRFSFKFSWQTNSDILVGLRDKSSMPSVSSVMLVRSFSRPLRSKSNRFRSWDFLSVFICRLPVFDDRPRLRPLRRSKGRAFFETLFGPFAGPLLFCIGVESRLQALPHEHPLTAFSIGPVRRLTA